MVYDSKREKTKPTMEKFQERTTLTVCFYLFMHNTSFDISSNFLTSRFMTPYFPVLFSYTISRKISIIEDKSSLSLKIPQLPTRNAKK